MAPTTPDPKRHADDTEGVLSSAPGGVGLRLHLVRTVHGLPVGWALTGAKADERHALAASGIELLRPAPQG